MVKRLMRTLLVLLLVTGVPVQGFAALGGGLCGALGHHVAESVRTAAAPDHAAHAGEHHHPGGAQSAPDEAFCASCASCGMAAAITHAPALLAPIAPAAGIAAAEFQAPPGFVPETPDRPPLTLLS